MQAGAEAGACTADDPVDGNSATALMALAGTIEQEMEDNPVLDSGRGRCRSARDDHAESEGDAAEARRAWPTPSANS